MAERIRVRCPICGMHPFLDQLLVAQGIPPAELRIFTLKFGGKLKTPPTGDVPEKKKKGGAPGYMEMVDVTDQIDPGLLEQVQEFFKKRALDYLAPEK